MMTTAMMTMAKTIMTSISMMTTAMMTMMIMATARPTRMSGLIL